MKKKDWLSDWKREAAQEGRKIYGLTIVGNEDVVQGLISIEDKGDHVFLHLIESNAFNRGKRKVYVGVPGNLVAYACKLSMELGYGGFVSFEAKTSLISHYQESLGADILFRNFLVIKAPAARRLIERYFPQMPEL